MRTRILFLAVILLSAACLPDDKLKIEFNMTPETGVDDWEISTPANEGLDENLLAAVYDRLFDEHDYETAESLLVIRNGKLVAEGYTRRLSDIDRLNNVKSVTKSVTSLLTGIAIERGYLEGVTQTVFSVFPEYFDESVRRRAITVEHLLTQTSGLHWDNSEDNDDWLVEEPADSVELFLSQSQDYRPGTRFHYSDANPHLLGVMIETVSGMALDELADEALFAPLGIDKYVWEHYQGDDTTFGAFGLYLRPRDMAKIGQLMLDQGAWKGKQLVAAQWVTDSTTTYTNQNDGPYGYLWWVRPDFGAYTAIGHGGQYVYVMPAAELVIVMTAGPYTDGIGVTVEEFEDLVYGVLKAVKE